LKFLRVSENETIVLSDVVCKQVRVWVEGVDVQLSASAAEALVGSTLTEALFAADIDVSRSLVDH
jgi:hypothetical protein